MLLLHSAFGVAASGASQVRRQGAVANHNQNRRLPETSVKADVVSDTDRVHERVGREGVKTGWEGLGGDQDSLEMLE